MPQEKIDGQGGDYRLRRHYICVHESAGKPVMVRRRGIIHPQAPTPWTKLLSKDTKTKRRHLKKWTCKWTSRQVFIRVYIDWRNSWYFRPRL